MMMKKLSAAALALVLSMSTIATTASADERGSSLAALYSETKLGADFVYNTGKTPDAPSTVSAVKRSNGMDLKWNAVSGADGYLIRAVHPAGERWGMYYEYVAGGNTTSFFWDYEWSKNKDWEFYISSYANGSYGQKNLSTTASQFAVTEAQTSTTPTKVEFTGYSKSSRYIELDWKAQNCDGYEVSFRDAGATEFSVLGNTSETHAKISQLQPGVTYYVRIRAYKMNGSEKVFGAYSEEKILTTDTENDNTQAPGSVTFKNVVSTDNSLRFSWDSVANCDGYQIYFNKTGNSTDWFFVANVKNTTLDYLFSNLDSDSNYWISVRPYKYDKSGNPVYGSWLNKQGTTDKKGSTSQTDNTQAPGAVTFKKVVSGEDSLRFYWDSVANCDGYQIYFNKTGNSSDWYFVANVNNTTLDYVFSNLESENNYWISVRAYKYNKSNNPVYGSWTNKQGTTDKKGRTSENVTAPAAVSINTSTAKVTYDTVTVSWNGVDCDGYEMWLNETGNDWKHVANVSKDTTTYRFNKLKPNHQYWFTVCAFNKLSNGDVIRGKFSDNYTTITKSSASASTNVAKPAKTEFTSFSRTSSAIRLNWTAVSCDGYFIYRYNYNTKAWERVSVIKGGNITTKRFANLNADTTYVYKIRAFKFNTNGTGKVYSQYSSPKYVTTKKK